MKMLSKVLLITLLAAIFALPGCNQSKLPEVKKSAIPLPTIKPSTAQNSVTVLFPQKANISLVKGVSKTGWARINLQAEQIEVSSSNDSETIDFDQIEKISFDLNRAIFSSEKFAIPNEKSSDFIQETWTQVSIDDFKLEKDKTGEVTVRMNNSALNQSAARDGIYVVEEILFDPSSQKMTLKVLCCTDKH